jgi:hypothetical protein
MLSRRAFIAGSAAVVGGGLLPAAATPIPDIAAIVSDCYCEKISAALTAQLSGPAPMYLIISHETFAGILACDEIIDVSTSGGQTS